MTRCADCGKNLDLVGKAHRCYPSVINTPPPAPEQATPLSTSHSTNAARQAKWREANPDIHRERSRNSMRKKRMAKKPAPAPSKPSTSKSSPAPAPAKKGGGKRGC